MRRRYSYPLAVLLLLGLWLRLPGPWQNGPKEKGPSPEAGLISVPVLFVPDGDTVKVSWQGREEWVRLLRIDTPERDEKGYEESRSALRSMAGGREAVLVFEEPGVPRRDDYKRLLAYLYVDGRNINIEMVKAGWSPFWTKYGEGRYAPHFREAEREARGARRGLWRRDTGGSR